jgi:hypothetical protein
MEAIPLGLPASPAEILRARYQGRLPSTLDDLAGPRHGMVQLPLHVAWSGMTAFDVERPGRCRSMYHIVLTDGQREDIIAYINRHLLVSQWPILRRLVGRVVRDVWESAFPELAERQASSV